MASPKKPPWLKIDLPGGGAFKGVKQTLRRENLCTVCVEASCPNLGECWGRGTMTVMILGDQCTRTCRFCNVHDGHPLPPDPQEPARVARTLNELNIRYGVITSVTRDDLPDFGAAHWAAVITALQRRGITVEALLPDFNGNEAALAVVADTKPHVFSHNLETVRRLTPQIRSRADYDRSLAVLKLGARRGLTTKSSLMLGMGETMDEVITALADLREAGVTRVAMGQYLQPSKAHLDVVEYLALQRFTELGEAAQKMGFTHVESGPLVRSSYHAERGHESQPKRGD